MQTNPLNPRNSGRVLRCIVHGVTLCGLMLALAAPALGQGASEGAKKATMKKSKLRDAALLPMPASLDASPYGRSYGSSRDNYRNPVRASGSSYGYPQTTSGDYRGPDAGNEYPNARNEYLNDSYRGYSSKPTSLYEDAGIPREAVLEWAMSSPPTAEDMPQIEMLLQKAYEIHPEVIAATAQVQQAQANLERARMDVAKEMVLLRARWQSRRQAVEFLTQALKKKPEDEQLLEKYIQARAKLAQVEMELPYVGEIATKKSEQPSARSGRTHVQYWDGNRLITALQQEETAGPLEIDPEIRKKLQKRVQLQFIDTELGEIFDYLGEACGVQFVINADITDMPVKLILKDVSLAAALQAIEDKFHGDVVFRIRPYGILVEDQKSTELLQESDAMRALRSDPVQQPIPAGASGMRVYPFIGPAQQPMAEQTFGHPAGNQPTWATSPEDNLPPTLLEPDSKPAKKGKAKKR